jgi:hypothetical protein
MAKPNLALIPATIGDKVYSILPSDGVGDFDFTRGTVATRINAQGLIEEVASGENRLNYSLLDGEVVGCPHLLLEPQRTNLIQYSEDFSNAYWTKSGSSIVSNNVISPDGSLNASKLVEDTANSDHSIYRAFTGLTSAVYTISAYVKKGERHKCALADRNTGVYVSFDLNNATIIEESLTVGNIESLPNGWYKLSATTSNALTTIIPQIFVLEDSYTTGTPILLPYIGDGTSGIYIYGAMLEEGSYPTSYIKTTSAAVTRAAETCNGSGNAATFNDSEGVLMAEISALAENSGLSRRITISDGSTNNRLSIELDETEGFIKVFFTGNGTLNQLAKNISDVYTPFKILVSYELNSLKLYINGYKITEDTSIVLPNGLDDLSFHSGTGSSNFYGNTKQIQYFDTTDIDLEQLTSWDSFRAMAEGQLYTIE